MKNIISISVLLWLINLNSFSQSLPIIEKGNDGIISSVRFPKSMDSENIPSSELVFFKEYLHTITDDKFVKVPHKSKRIDFVHDHFDQYYKNVEVDGGGYNFHYQNGRMYFANGHYVKIDNINVVPTLKADQALKTFLKYKEIPDDRVRKGNSSLKIKEIQDNATGKVRSVNLVYRIYVDSDHSNNSEIGYVDAHTGSILLTEPIMMDALGTFETRYSGDRTADTQPLTGGGHRLFDNTRGATIHTQNLQNSTANLGSAVELTDADNDWTTAEHGANNNDMGLDVHWGLQRIYDYFNSTHGINSFDDAGHAINAYVRYGDTDTRRDNAAWRGDDAALVFGQGVSVFRPLASIDVVAHEYAHAITDAQIGWGATGDQRAFHEGLSDIWGAILEHRIRPNNTWEIGEQVMQSHSYLRNISNTNDVNAYTKISDTFGSTQYNLGDSYVRSGVFSHWFFIVAQGESGVNDLSQYYQVSGIGIDKAEALIVEAIFNNYLDGTTSYAQIRTAMLAAADAIFCDYDWTHKTITDAWYAVGVGSAFSGPLASISGSDIICTTQNYSITNLPSGTSVIWSSSNPSILSLNSSTGVATKIASGPVKIIADVSGSCGSFRVVKDVFSGTPDLNKFYVRDAGGGAQPIVLDNYGTISVKVSYQDDPLFLSGISQYEWNVPYGTVTQSTWFQSPAMNEVDIFYSNGSYPSNQQVYLRAQNTCGWSPWDEMIWPVDNSSYFAYTIFPNPATVKLTVAFEKADRKEGLPRSISLLNEKSTVPIQKIDVWNKYQKGEMLNNQIGMDVSSLPRGRYFLHIQYEGKESEIKMHQILLN